MTGVSTPALDGNCTYNIATAAPGRVPGTRTETVTLNMTSQKSRVPAKIAARAWIGLGRGGVAGGVGGRFAASGGVF